MAEKLYKCRECGMFYKEKKWAGKCEDFCKKNNACSIEIINHSVGKKIYIKT